MRVVHLTGKDFYGAGRAAYRLHSALLKEGVDSLMVVGEKESNDGRVVNIQDGAGFRFLRKVFIRIEKMLLHLTPGTLFSSGTCAFRQTRRINKLKPDIVHIHWINRGFFNIRALTRIKAPVVVSMHDMWYYTGGCHYATNCFKYRSGCEGCIRAADRSTAQRVMRWHGLKSTIYNQTDKLAFVGLSRWMEQCAKESALLHHQHVLNLPNCIDTTKYVANEKARKDLDFGEDKKLILFAAVDALSDKNKGFDLLEEALSYLPADRYALLIVGDKGKTSFDHLSFSIHNTGFVKEEGKMIDYLSAADVVVVPSRMENLSNMIMEALACATPVVAFATGGNGDMIEHKVNGYLAEAFSSNDLAQGIGWCLEDDERQKELSARARSAVLEKFNETKVGSEYRALYQQLTAGYAH
ncbi:MULTISPECIES: glycosyltransferase [unclassified Carboxylicivirga]|uniref:glycosyltransferase n=1 Tax=Carboxylicivirga TaxID=1628153 RepID=UPI003D34B62A